MATQTRTTDAWKSITELRGRPTRDRAATERELNSMFRSGELPKDLTGPTEGMLVTTVTNPLLDPVVRLITNLWMPWHGKRFDDTGVSGTNVFADSAVVPARLLWPFYKTTDAESGRLAFDFATYPDAGQLDPDVQVMVIDYAAVDGNPRLIIRRIRDELVEVHPHVYLGKVLFQLPTLPSLPGMDTLHKVPLIQTLASDRYALIGYFALRCAG